MILDIYVNGEGMVADVPPEKLGHTTEPMKIGVLAGGMTGGAPSVGIALYLPNGGGCVLGETSLALFLTAADAFRAGYGDPRETK